MERKPEKQRLTVEEAREREERLTAAGITVERPGTSTVTLAKREAPAEGPLEDDDGSGADE